MATNAKLGALSSLKLGDGASPEVFTTVAEVLRVGSIGQSASEIEVTHLSSTSKEYIGGLSESSTVEFSLNFVGGTQQNALRDGVGDTKNFVMQFSDNTQASFAFVVLGFARDETSPEAQLTATVNGRITGDITWGIYT
jgi:hypothetical protein